MKLIDWKSTFVTDGFWKQKEELNRKVTMRAVYDRFYDTGRIDAFKFNWREGMKNKPHIFWDSDIAKWMEGAAYILHRNEDKELEAKVESLIDLIEENIGRDGYFNIYFTVIEPSKRFTDRSCHELYCAGHLIEASVAYYEATGKDRFLKLMERYADYIYKVFAEENSAAFCTCGHPEIELALYRLYKATDNKKYFDLCEFFLLSHGNNEKDEIVHGHDITYAQDFAPLIEQTYAAGHSVRAMYLYCALADYAAETKNEKVKKTCMTLLDDVIEKKMYITGALGSTYKIEGFTRPYDLPNDTAYAETCASIGLMLFANRMLRLENNAKYADIAERAMYNGMLSGISISGKAFFYENPLEIYMAKRNRFYAEKEAEHFSITQRVEVFGCSCCPPNLSRTLSSMGNFIYGTDGDTIYVNQYMSSFAECGKIKITQSTDYPKCGTVKITAEGARKIALRIPSWCKDFKLNAAYEMKNGYAVAENTGSEIILDLEIKPFLVSANPLVYDNFGKAALQMGPVVYCAERIDNDCDLHTLLIDKNINCTIGFNHDLNCETIEVKGYRAKARDELYFEFEEKYEDTTIKFIPYSCFANRGESDMRVWMGYR